MRELTVDCDICGERSPMQRAKEALFEVGKNAYHVMDLCSGCLDTQLKNAESVNDTSGYRQKAAVLLRLPGNEVPRSD